jgi:hypothetical protein
MFITNVSKTLCSLADAYEDQQSLSDFIIYFNQGEKSTMSLNQRLKFNINHRFPEFKKL